MYVAGVRIAATVAALLYASIQDWRKREVEDTVWKVMLAVGVPLTTYDLWRQGSTRLAVLSLLSIIVITGIALAVFYANLFGGADAKAFIALGIMSPLPPITLQGPSSYPFFPLAVFNNSILFSLSAAVYVAARNFAWILRGKALFEGLESEKWYRKLTAFFTGFRIDAGLLPRWKHHRLLTTQDGQHSKLVFFAKDEEQPPAQGLAGNVWVTPLLPMIIYVTIGYVAAVVAGDLVLRIILVLSMA